jgi:hypothetical protein
MAAVSVCPRHPQGPHLACPARFRPSSARGPSYSSPHVGLRCHGSHRARRSDGRPLTTCTSLLCGVQGQKAMWPVLPTLKCHCRVELELADCAARLQQQTRAEPDLVDEGVSDGDLFVPSIAYDGSRPGYVYFRSSKFGTGYYRDGTSPGSCSSAESPAAVAAGPSVAADVRAPQRLRASSCCAPRRTSRWRGGWGAFRGMRKLYLGPRQPWRSSRTRPCGIRAPPAHSQTRKRYGGHLSLVRERS